MVNLLKKANKRPYGLSIFTKQIVMLAIIGVFTLFQWPVAFAERVPNTIGEPAGSVLHVVVDWDFDSELDASDVVKGDDAYIVIEYKGHVINVSSFDVLLDEMKTKDNDYLDSTDPLFKKLRLVTFTKEGRQMMVPFDVAGIRAIVEGNDQQIYVVLSDNSRRLLRLVSIPIADTDEAIYSRMR